MILGLVPGVVLTTKAAALCVELLVQLDRTQTPEAAFRSLTDAHAALIRAKHALEAELNARRHGQ
ncbi:MAG TPA: hypothetical protein PKC36_12650 [Dietzia sp.]|mgnify:CR=1 FL=1|nr:hypothetical protein [Dietzia sp.]